MTLQANKYYEVKTDAKPPYAKYTGIKLKGGKYVFSSKEVGLTISQIESDPWLAGNDKKGINLLIAYYNDLRLDLSNTKLFFKDKSEIYREITLKEKFLLLYLYL